MLLVLLLVANFVYLRVLARESDRLTLAAGAVGLTSLYLVLFGALLMPWFAPPTVALLLAAGAIPALHLAHKGEPLTGDLPTLLLALPGAAMVVVSALFIQSVSQVVEDSFFVHTSNIGTMLNGIYPPQNFLGETFQGHHGKDLLTALLALGSERQFLDVEWCSTWILCLAHFLFLAGWLTQASGSRLTGLLGAYFAFFGSSFGSFLGLQDVVTNNNAVAYFALSLCSYLGLRTLQQNRLPLALLAGAALGVDALIYEVHFGLVGLVLVTLALPRRSCWKNALVLVTLAGFLACVEGGAVTHIARRALGFGPKQDVKTSWQSQDVRLRIPKEQPFCLRRDNLRPSRFFETKLRPWQADFSSSRELAPVLSPAILSCFWYPTWLAPLTLGLLIWNRDALAGWFFLLGAYSILTPCVVGFGYFDNETGRWLLGGAMGLSTAYALCLGRLCARKPRIGGILLLWTVWFNLPALTLRAGEIAGCLAHPGQTLPNGSPGIVPGGGLVPDPRRSLFHHYGFPAAGWQTTAWLRAHARPGDRYLANYKLDPAPAPGVRVEQASGGVLNQIGLQTGLSGLFPAGIQGAPATEWASPVYSQSLEALAFWADGEPARLSHLGAKWLLVDDTLVDVKLLHGLETRFQSGTRRVMELVREPDPLPAREAEIQPFVRLSAAPQSAFAVSAQGSGWVQVRYREKASGQLAGTLDTPVRGPRVTLVAPYYPAVYAVEWQAVGGEWRPLGELEAR